MKTIALSRIRCMALVLGAALALAGSAAAGSGEAAGIAWLQGRLRPPERPADAGSGDPPCCDASEVLPPA